MVRVFGSLLKREDIEDPGRYIWTVAHHALSNYYRDGSKRSFGLSPEEIPEGSWADGSDVSSEMILRDESERLQREIAYLSELQRRIVIAYYYDNKKQQQIAEELNLPLGTVKWHLFEARKNLKRGMETMRVSSELKFKLIRFSLCGTNGSVGSKGGNHNFFRTALPQNIEYAVCREPKTVNEIADLISRGLLSRSSESGELKTALGCIFIDGAAAKRSLLSIGDRIRETHREEFDALRKMLTEAYLKEMPEHLHTMKKFGLQFLFCCDGWFCLHCLKELVNSGRLKLPSAEEKRALTMILIRN